jgi:hypothetical protein
MKALICIVFSFAAVWIVSSLLPKIAAHQFFSFGFSWSIPFFFVCLLGSLSVVYGKG